MLLNLYALMLALSLYFNRHDKRMLVLSLMVAASVFTPVPRHTAFAFYLFCIAADSLVGLVALSLKCRAGDIIANVCALLVVTHVLGYSLDGNQAFSPYRSIVKLLEVSEFLACLACSPALTRVLRNRDQTTQ